MNKEKKDFGWQQGESGQLLEVCIPKLVLNETRQDETRLEGTSRIGETETIPRMT